MMVAADSARDEAHTSASGPTPSDAAPGPSDAAPAPSDAARASSDAAPGPSDAAPGPAGSDACSELRLGEYLVIRMIGEGGMGRVYEAQERLSMRRVALKVLREDISQREEARALFLQETQILAHLEHPNIVRSLASLEADGKLITVLEFLDGQTLRQAMSSRGSFDWQEAAGVVLCMARALTAAHGQEPPVIHRDLKPENVMLLDDGTVKVTDFGIAKLVQELNQTNTQSVGTLLYMSPEQIDAKTVDQRADLYCLGLVFYELLAGRPPFQAASPRTLLNLQCTEPPPPLDDDVRIALPKGIEALLQQLLEKEPEARPESAEAVVAQLEAFLPAANVTKPPLNPKRKADDDGAEPSAASSEPAPDTARSGPLPTERNDTIALIDAAQAPRELSLSLSLWIVVLAMIGAGLTTYYWKRSLPAAPSDFDAASSFEPAADFEPAAAARP